MLKIRAAERTRHDAPPRDIGEAISNLDVEAVEQFLREGANPNGFGPTGWRRQRLLEHAANQSGVPPKYGRWHEHGRDYKGFTYLERRDGAIRIIELLIAQGAQPNSCKDILVGPILTESDLVLERLLELGVDPDRNHAVSPLYVAYLYRNSQAVKLLLEHGADSFEQRDLDQIMLVSAAQHGDINGMKQALKSTASTYREDVAGRTALAQAISHGEGEAALFLLENRARPNAKSKTGIESGAIYETTPLHEAVGASFYHRKKDGHGELHVEAQWLDFIRELLRHGARVSITRQDGMTPLHLAARRDYVNVARVLLDEGAKVMPQDVSGKRPLDYAESGEMIKLLKEYGAQEIVPAN